MNYKPLPLFYAANEEFKNTIRFSLEMSDDADLSSLQYAADQIQKRYPYFPVRVEAENESFVLVPNETIKE